MKFGTKVIHAGIEPDSATGAIMTPIYQTSTYAQNSVGEHMGYAYSRTQNPTRHTLEKNIAALENGKYGMCFSSGMAAIDAVLKTLTPGDEVLSISDLYGGTYRLFENTFAKFGIVFNYAPMVDAKSLEQFLTPQTKLVWIETPTNPMMNIVDVEAIVKVAHVHSCVVAVDNTFATPYLQNPLDLGADLVMHSATKFLGGHSDVVLGALVCNDRALADQLYFVQNSNGAVPGPQDCFLVLRGIKTLHLRMQRHSENAAQVAQFLESHPAIRNVYWPGLPQHPNHEVARRQMREFGGMLSFSLKDDTRDAAFRILEKTTLFTLAESLGGVESLIGHPATMTHAAIPRESRLKSGVVDSLIRLSVGVEDIDDLLRDLQQSLQ